MKTTQLLLTCSTILLTLGANAAIDITPSFDTAPTGWTTDRYDPTSFGNVGTYQGRANVLGISITSAGNLANRPAAFQSSFYNTQGRQHAITGGAGSVISADLYIPASWSNPLNGSVRTDMWGVTTPSPTQYPIVGFSNYGDAGARFRVWDADTASGWVDLGTSVTYDAWTSLAIEFTGSSYIFLINGINVYTDSSVGVAAGFSAMIMQAYNFADPTITGATLVDYTANWSNTPVPEPSTYLAGALLLLPFGASTIRIMRKKLTA